MKLTRTRRRSSLVAGAVGLMAAALLLAGCGGAATGNEGAVQSDGSVDLSKVTLIVGDQKGTSARALLSAAGLDDTEYRIQWQEFTSGPPLLEALNAGSIHVGQVGNTPPIFAAAAKGTFKMVQAVSFTGKGDVILVPKDSPIKTVADLEGKDVAVAEGSSANYNLLAQLDHAGLKYSDVDVQNLQPADALAAFTSGHLDAWATWDPFTSQAVIDEGARVLADGNDLLNGVNFQVASERGARGQGDQGRAAGLPGPDHPGPAVGRPAPGRVVEGVGRADRPVARHHPRRRRAAPADRRADRPLGHRFRAGDGGHVLRQRPAPRCRRRVGVLHLGVQRLRERAGSEGRPDPLRPAPPHTSPTLQGAA